jgi:zinc transport system substrate-binding protein
MLKFHMKKLLFILLSLLVTSSAFAKLNIIVSIQPQLEFVSKIGGDKIETSLMVLPGNSPHTYEPKPSQMIAISRANLYLAIGVEFEKVWLDKFKNQNQKLIVKDITKDINRTAMKSYHHSHNRDEIALDPHIWVDPINVKQIARNIFEVLSKLDTKNRSFYKKRLDIYLKELDQLDIEIKEILKDTPKETKFMVFHPSWGYFAKEYDLEQIPIQIDGKEPKPNKLKKIIELAKKDGIKTIIASPEFSDIMAKQIANELKISVVKLSSLEENWSENLINFAKAVANSR